MSPAWSSSSWSRPTLSSCVRSRGNGTAICAMGFRMYVLGMRSCGNVENRAPTAAVNCAMSMLVPGSNPGRFADATMMSTEGAVSRGAGVRVRRTRDRSMLRADAATAVGSCGAGAGSGAGSGAGAAGVSGVSAGLSSSGFASSGSGSSAGLSPSPPSSPSSVSAAGFNRDSRSAMRASRSATASSTAD